MDSAHELPVSPSRSALGYIILVTKSLISQKPINRVFKDKKRREMVGFFKADRAGLPWGHHSYLSVQLLVEVHIEAPASCPISSWQE
jgi:hypothetical protein